MIYVKLDSCFFVECLAISRFPVFPPRPKLHHIKIVLKFVHSKRIVYHVESTVLKFEPERFIIPELSKIHLVPANLVYVVAGGVVGAGGGAEAVMYRLDKKICQHSVFAYEMAGTKLARVYANTFSTNVANFGQSGCL